MWSQHLNWVCECLGESAPEGDRWFERWWEWMCKKIAFLFKFQIWSLNSFRFLEKNKPTRLVPTALAHNFLRYERYSEVSMEDEEWRIPSWKALSRGEKEKQLKARWEQDAWSTLPLHSDTGHRPLVIFSLCASKEKVPSTWRIVHWLHQLLYQREKKLK